MSKNTHKWLAGLTALALLASAPEASAAEKKRKAGFFDRLFSSSGVKKKKPVKRNTFFTWLQNDDEVNLIYGNESRRKYRDFDPEPLPTLGMGNLTYAAPRFVPLFDANAAKKEATSPAAMAIRQLLANPKTGLKTDARDRDAIISHYAQTRYAPVWLVDGKLSERAKLTLKRLDAAATEGLLPETYRSSGLADVSDTSLAQTFDLETTAALDISITRSALLYARHVASGLFEPNKLSLYHDIKPEENSANSVLRVLAYSPFPEVFLTSLAPKHPAYAQLRQHLAEIDTAMQTKVFAAFEATGKRVKAGQRDRRIPDLRQRLLELTHLEPGEALVPEADVELLDKALSQALKTFQKSNGIKQSGNLDGATETVLSIDPRQRQRDKLAINMERLRWIPRDLGLRHVFVNQAAFDVVVNANGRQIWESKVIVGRPLTQTAVFNDTMETVVFNPSWGVPQSILVNEYLPKLLRDPGHFDRIGYKVVNSNGNVVSSRSVDWGAYGNKIPYGVQQPPGPENALGKIKFLFPNSHDIYMHDTPTRKLFGETVRSFSHGCVRVENPQEFAAVLLGWQRSSIENRIESGESTSVRLPAPYRVHLNYFTAWPTADGKVNYHADIYGRDETMFKALAAMRKSRPQSTDLTLLQMQKSQPTTAQD